MFTGTSDNSVDAAQPIAPDWSTVEEQIDCPMCEYNLRGLTEPRCPECGYKFDWQEILDARRRPHPFLYEHHRERNFWSFYKTAIAASFPRSFWKKLHPAMPSSPRRIVGYWLRSSFVLMVGLLSLCAQPFINDPKIRITAWEGKWAQFAFDFPDFAALGAAVFLAIAWPWLVCGVLLIFQASMKRAKVRPVHVLRTTIYSMSDGSLWIGLAMIVTALLPFISDNSSVGWGLNMYGYAQPDEKMIAWLTLVGAVCIIVGAWRLFMAYRIYLQFRHAFAVVFCAELIVVLAVLFVLLHTDMPLGRAYFRFLEELTS